MAILDVESLFTYIPLEEMIENCVNDLFFDKSKIDDSCIYFEGTRIKFRPWFYWTL